MDMPSTPQRRPVRAAVAVIALLFGAVLLAAGCATGSTDDTDRTPPTASATPSRTCNYTGWDTNRKGGRPTGSPQPATITEVAVERTDCADIATFVVQSAAPFTWLTAYVTNSDEMRDPDGRQVVQGEQYVIAVQLRVAEGAGQPGATWQLPGDPTAMKRLVFVRILPNGDALFAMPVVESRPYVVSLQPAGEGAFSLIVQVAHAA